MRTLLLLLLTAPLVAQPTGERLDAYLTARSNLGQFSGSVLVAHEGKVLLRKGYGYANLEHLVPNAPETKFEIASLTKAFTAFAIHDLARQEKLRLDAPLCTYVEACPETWKEITLAQVVHHTSGIPDHEGNDDSPKAAVEAARVKPLDFAPGSKFKYSNTGYLLLGLIIERVSGKTYEEYLRERIFTPLGMTSTMHVDRTRPQPRRADGYTHQAPLPDTLAGIDPASPHLRRTPQPRQEAPQSDGGLLSTVDDLHLWARALLGKRELFQPNEPGNYAAGWYVTKRYDRALYQHTGILPGMVSTFHIYPDSETILILLGNLDRARMGNITRDLTNIVFERPYDVPRARKVTTIGAERAARLLGEYHLSDGRVMTITHDAKNGWLEAAVKDEFSAGVLPESDLVFYAPMWEGTLTFVPESDGTVKTLIMRQTGVDIRGSKRSAQ
jgi:CubicO group peptidase (beta-lactamase class C family)